MTSTAGSCFPLMISLINVLQKPFPLLFSASHIFRCLYYISGVNWESSTQFDWIRIEGKGHKECNEPTWVAFLFINPLNSLMLVVVVAEQCRLQRRELAIEIGLSDRVKWSFRPGELARSDPVSAISGLSIRSVPASTWI